MMEVSAIIIGPLSSAKMLLYKVEGHFSYNNHLFEGYTGLSYNHCRVRPRRGCNCQLMTDVSTIIVAVLILREDAIAESRVMPQLE